jgi:excinuclease ABC subunit A
LVVITGISGSGKSSLAFDTIYAEGQRRYMEHSLLMLDSLWVTWKNPDVEYIGGLSPVISIEQKTTSKKSSFYGRYGYRDIRFSAPALRKNWRRPLYITGKKMVRYTERSDA